MNLFVPTTILSFFSLSRCSGISGLVSTRTSTRLQHHTVAEATFHQSSLRSISPLALLTRRSLLIATMTTTASSLSPTPSNQRLEQSILLLDSIYSPVNSTDFPLPMSKEEAGPCTCMFGSTPQRRYLWTDAFAVLTYQTISNIYFDLGEVQTSNLYKEAVEKLIATVHQCLGRPRSGSEVDAMTPCDVSPTGYVGLRIGKVDPIERRSLIIPMHFRVPSSLLCFLS